MVTLHIIHFLADSEISNAVKSLPGSGNANFTSGTIQTLFNIVMGTLTSVALLIIVLAGFKYVTSSGDPQGVASARKSIIYALVGFVVCAASWSIVTFTVKGV
jgi:hypothetical protein